MYDDVAPDDRTATLLSLYMHLDCQSLPQYPSVAAAGRSPPQLTGCAFTPGSSSLILSLTLASMSLLCSAVVAARPSWVSASRSRRYLGASE